MSSVEAFRLRLFSPRCVVSADELVRRTANAARMVRVILHPFVPEHRLGFETPLDGEGWLVVLLRDENQMHLQMEVKAKFNSSLSLDTQANAAASAFRLHCEGLLAAIRKARLDRQDLEDLHRQAKKAYADLTSLVPMEPLRAQTMSVLTPNSSTWSPVIPELPNRVRAVDEVITVSFEIEAVGESFALILLDKASRLLLDVFRARTRLSWKPLEQPSGTSTSLHQAMLQHLRIQAECSRMLGHKGGLYGLALHSLPPNYTERTAPPLQASSRQAGQTNGT